MAHAQASSLRLRRLKIFESVARLSSLRRASEDCHLSQPAISQAISNLEEELGVALLDRRTDGSYMTEFGVIFQRRVQRMYTQIDDALRELGVSSAVLATVANRITSSQIRSLIAVAEYGSFAGAGDALGLTRAYLQRSARSLEQDLHKTLFRRTATGIVATAAAVECARKLKLALREIEAAVEELKAANGGGGSRIMIGAMLMSGNVMLANVLDEFISTYPTANVGTASGNAEDILHALRMGEVDLVIGLLSDPPSTGLASEAVVTTPYVVVARQGHPLARKRKVTLDDLGSYDWVIGTQGSNRYQRFETLFADRKRPPARVETSSLATITHLLARADRLTLLTSYELKYATSSLKALAFGPLHPAPAVGLITRKGWMPTPLQAKFMDLFRARVRSVLEWTPSFKQAS